MYASPEQKSGQPICASSDIYSLGKLLSYLFPDEPIQSDIWTIQQKATQQNSADRYMSIQSLRADIESILAVRPISLKKHVPFYASKRLFQRHPIACCLAIVLCLSAGLFSTALVIKNHQLKQEKLIAENMMFEVTSMMFHSTAPQARHISAHTMLDLTRRRILSNPDIPKHIKQKMLIAMMTPAQNSKNISGEPVNAPL
jgi:serine/threonine-protein kinase